MVAIVRYSDKKGLITTIKGNDPDSSVYMAELMSQLQPILQKAKTRRYLNNRTRPRFYLRIAMTNSKNGTSINVNLKDYDGVELGLNQTYKTFKDVHGIAHFVNQALEKTGWLNVHRV